MKYVNFYSGMALVLIASLLGSLGSTTGELAPPLIVGALLFTVLVLGWAGGASDSRHELDRLTRLESGRQLLTQSHIKQRDKLEAALARLQHRIEEVTASNAGLRKVAERWADEVGNLRAQARDSQAAIELFTTAQAKNMIRITALEGENGRLRARAADVDWPLHPFAIVYGRAMDSDNIELAAFDAKNYLFPDGDCFERDGDTLDGFMAEFLTHHQLEVRLIESAENAKKWHEAHSSASDRITVLEVENAELRKRPAIDVAPGAAGGVDHENDMAVDSFAAAIKAKLSTRSVAGGGGWNDPAQCSIEHLQGVLVEWVAKGDPVSVGALAMMIQQRGGRTALAQHQQNPLIPLLAPQPLVEPVYIGKALMAHREARVVLDGGTGPVAAVHLVNISLTAWVHTKDTAEAYASGWNSGVRALRGALTEAVVGKLLPVALGDSK